MRLELKDGINGEIVTDSYLTSTRWASLLPVVGSRRETLILSDIEQSGSTRPAVRRGGRPLKANGDRTDRHRRRDFRMRAFDCREFYHHRKFLRGTTGRAFRKASCKGGRRFQFERIGRILEDKIRPYWKSTSTT